MKVSVNNHTYEMKKHHAKKFVRRIAEQFVGKFMIVAVRKGEHIEMRKDVFSSKDNLKAEEKKWNEKGYVVCSALNLNGFI